MTRLKHSIINGVAVASLLSSLLVGPSAFAAPDYDSGATVYGVVPDGHKQAGVFVQPKGGEYGQTADTDVDPVTNDARALIPAVVIVDSSGAPVSSGGSGSDGVAIGSTTSGQSGVLAQCAVTTSAPTYVTGKTDPLSCDTNGGVRVNAGTTIAQDTSVDGLEALITLTNTYVDGIEALLGTSNTNTGAIATTNTNLGAPGATACATDTGSCSVNALLQRLASRLSTLNTTLGTPLQAGGTVATITNPVGVKGLDGSAIASSSNPNPTVTLPSTSSTVAVAPTGTTANASSLVLCAAACNVYDFHVTATSVAGYVILVNATSAPSNGAITGVLACTYVGTAPGTMGFSYGSLPLRASTGATLLFSTTGCHTLTLSATAEFFGRVQ